ncbi:Appr-1-p processing protein, partial [Ancylothrix sp. C2]|nr:Appr-1-p processing protein [Ancylothrix sp. D3o]
YVLPEGRDAAQKCLATDIEAQERLQRVGDLIFGFETPYGMELLATTHWVAKEHPKAVEDSNEAILLVHQWSERKRQLFKSLHIRKAWQRLREQHWLTTTNHTD